MIEVLNVSMHSRARIIDPTTHIESRIIADTTLSRSHLASLLATICSVLRQSVRSCHSTQLNDWMLIDVPALHSAAGLNGAQFYMTCFQLTVSVDCDAM